MLTLDCSNSRRTTYSFRSKSRPRAQSAGRATKHWQMQGMQSRAFWPSTSGWVGTSRQPRKVQPLLGRDDLQHLLGLGPLQARPRGRRTCPRRSPGDRPGRCPSAAAAFTISLWGTWIIRPTPSPVSPAASLPARCSSFSTIFRASVHSRRGTGRALQIHHGADAAGVVLQPGDHRSVFVSGSGSITWRPPFLLIRCSWPPAAASSGVVHPAPAGRSPPASARRPCCAFAKSGGPPPRSCG